MLVPIVVIAFLFTIGVYVIYRLEKSNPRWNRKAALIQTIGVVWALAFAVYSIKTANEGTNATINEINRLFSTSKKLSDQFEKLSANLSSMPKQLESFSNKLIKLDSTIDKQQKNISSNLNNFKNTISDFDKSLFTYKNSIDDYSSQLSKIVSATDSQLVIWKEQQAIVKKEYSRRPILNIRPLKFIQNDSTFTIDGIMVVNSGNIEVTMNAIIFSMSTKDLIKVDSKIMSKTKTELSNDYYQMDFKHLTQDQISQHDSMDFKDIKITMRINKELKKSSSIPNLIFYFIKYRSQYTSDPFNGILFCNQIIKN